MSMELTRGQRLNIGAHIKAVMIQTEWDAGSAADQYDIDASAFLLGKDGRVRRESDFIFYNNPAPDHGVSLCEKQTEPQKDRLIIDFDRLEEDVERIEIVMSIYEPEQRQQSFGAVRKLHLKANQYNIETKEEGPELFTFGLTEELTVETAVILCEWYRYKGVWKVNAVGAGYQAGLRALCEQFHITVI